MSIPRPCSFQSTLPARGATVVVPVFFVVFVISIHAPREGSDRQTWSYRYRAAHFNPRSPRGERPGFEIAASATEPFQSTLPARGATVSQLPPSLTFSNFNPRSPRGERHCTRALAARANAFQSTLPARGATGRGCIGAREVCISIHAPREGSDPSRIMYHPFFSNFNPRSPRGERHSSSLSSW